MRVNRLVVVLLSLALLTAISIHSTIVFAQASASDIQKKIDEAIRLRDKEKNTNAAMKILKEVLAEEPHNFGALVLLAELYLNNGDFDNAAKNVDNALSISPSNVYALRVKGDLLLQQGKLKEAEGIFHKAVAASAPKSLDRALSYFGLSNAYLKQGEKHKAKEFITKAMEDDPTNPAFKEQMKAIESMDTR